MQKIQIILAQQVVELFRARPLVVLYWCMCSGVWRLFVITALAIITLEGLSFCLISSRAQAGHVCRYCSAALQCTSVTAGPQEDAG